MEHTLYCVSNASTNIYEHNVLTSFKNLLPKNLDLQNKYWEVGVAAMGMNLDYETINLSQSEPLAILLDTKHTSIKKRLHMPEWKDFLSLRLIANSLNQFLLPSSLSLFIDKSESDPKKHFFTIFQDAKGVEVDLLIHPEIVKIFNIKLFNSAGQIKSDGLSSLKFYVHFNIQRGDILRSQEKDMDTPLTPDLISISSNIVSHFMGGDGYSTTMYSTNAPNSSLGRYFYHNVKNIRYYPVRQTNIEAIEIKLSNAYGKKLPLKEGQPTIVHLNLREVNGNMDHDTFHIQIESDSETTNSNSEFWSHLKRPIFLRSGATLALMDISFPSFINNIPSYLANKKFKIRRPVGQTGEKTEIVELSIPAGYYPSADILVDSINHNLPYDMRSIIKFSVIKNHFKVIAKSKQGISVDVPKEFREILGLLDCAENTDSNLDLICNRLEDENYYRILLDRQNQFVAPEPINIYKHYPGVIVCYSNFVQHSIMGDSFYPIFKIIPTSSLNNGDYTSIHFDNLEYVKCNMEHLDRLKFELRRLDGDLIEFSNNRKVILNIVVKNPK